MRARDQDNQPARNRTISSQEYIVQAFQLISFLCIDRYKLIINLAQRQLQQNEALDYTFENVEIPSC